MIDGATETCRAELDKVVDEERLIYDVTFMGYIPFSEMSDIFQQCHF